MEYTTNLNLKKPDVNEYYNIEQENENKDLIDSAIGELNKNFEWTKVGEVIGTESVQLPLNFNELQIMIMNENTATVISYHMSKAEVNDVFAYAVSIGRSSMNVLVGGGDSTVGGSGLAFLTLATNLTVYLNHFEWNSNDLTNTSKMIVYVR